MRVNNKFLVGSLITIVVLLLGGIGACMAEPQYSFIANDLAQHIGFLASNGEWHAAAMAAIANIKIYLTTKEVATRYGIDPRSVQRRVKEGLLPEPKYFGTRFPRWSIAELDENDRKYASVRVENVGAIAALAAKKDKAAAAKPVEDKTEAQAEVAKAKAAKPKLAEKPARPRKERAAATEQRPSSHRAAHGASHRAHALDPAQRVVRDRTALDREDDCAE